MISLKTFLGILVLGLMWFNVGFADIQDVKKVLKKIKYNIDISMGFNKFRDP